ncbi:hypothetical protein AVEN_85730-1 [Araneus ventricosus]|uniref:RNase H type-1 domain-containing protein n=1 Tax=Araneus ventricosus TaxID=182803 RepID=A0A4Y2V9T4_ARAVE|nr:hypothetical protein AVEN_85730-1 [Araneus ventricosus]
MALAPLNPNQPTIPPWKVSNLHILNPFESFNKSDTADIIYQQIFKEHRHQYRRFVPVYTDESKSADQVSLAVVFQNTVSSFRLSPACSIFTAEITAVLHALERISKSVQRGFIIYSDSLSVLNSLKSFHDHKHPLVFKILDLFEKLTFQGFTILFSWIPSHVGIDGNEEADMAAKSASLSTVSTIPVNDLKKYIKQLLFFQMAGTMDFRHWK